MYLNHLLNETSLQLYDGRHEIGPHEDANVYLQNEQSAKVKVVYTDGVLSILGAEGKIWLNGQVVHDFPVDMKSGDVLSLAENEHLLLSETEGDLVDVPNLEMPPVAEGAKPRVSIKLPKQLISVMGVALMISLGVGAVGYHYGVADRVDDNIVSTPADINPAPEKIISYTKDYLGKNLIQAYFEDDGLHVVVETSSLDERFQKDVKLVLKQQALHFESYNMEAIESELRQGIGTKSVKLEWNGRRLVLTGQATPHQVPVINQTAQSIQQQYGFLEIDNQVTTDNRFSGIKVLNTSVSAKQAVTTLKYNQQLLTLREGDSFELGRVKLVRHDGVTLATVYGDLELRL